MNVLKSYTLLLGFIELVHVVVCGVSTSDISELERPPDDAILEARCLARCYDKVRRCVLVTQSYLRYFYAVTNNG